MNYLGIFLSILTEPLKLIYIIIGVTGGVVIGALPGLNGPIGVTLLLPFTYGMDPATGLLMLSGLYMGSAYGGSISAILVNTPGTGMAACTALNGYPLTCQGRGKEALYYSIFSSTIGGFVGVFFLLLFAPSLATIALRLGPPEMILVMMAGLFIVGGLSGKDIFKGILAGAFGILLGTIGPDVVSGATRFSFGFRYLAGGFPLMPILIGLFAISEMFILSMRVGGIRLVDIELQETKPADIFKKLIKNPLVFKSSIIGALIGILPGAGGAIASFFCYGEAKRSSKTPELYGKGCVEGIIASESANNAAVGGSMVPLLALGIPGSTTAAILYGAIAIHGIIPGPRLFVNNPEFVHYYMIGMLFTVIVMFLLGYLGINLFIKSLKIKLVYLIPSVITLCILGSYSVRHSHYDILIAIIFGIIGVIFKRLEIPVAPVLLGLILGPLTEKSLRQTMIISRAAQISLLEYFLGRPLFIGLFFALSLFGFSIIRVLYKAKNTEL